MWHSLAFKELIYENNASRILILIIGYIFGFYMAWNIGANDVANSMASLWCQGNHSSPGSIYRRNIKYHRCRIYRLPRDQHHSKRDCLNGNSDRSPCGPYRCLSALLAAALWVSFATWKSLPVSTTHSIVGAMIGFGIMAGGFSSSIGANSLLLF